MTTGWTAIGSRHVSGAHSKAFVMKAVGAEGAHQKLTAIRADDAGVDILPRPQVGIQMLKFFLSFMGKSQKWVVATVVKFGDILLRHPVATPCHGTCGRFLAMAGG